MSTARPDEAVSRLNGSNFGNRHETSEGLWTSWSSRWKKKFPSFNGHGWCDEEMDDEKRENRTLLEVSL